MNKKIVVVGSSNTDMVVGVDHFPLPGETIMGQNFMTAQGGKGANQAVAVKRLGGEAVFVCCLGNDVFGQQTLEVLKAEGIDTEHVRLIDGAASGVALISVDQKAENCIIVAQGANALLSENDVEAAQEDIESASILLMQLETPVKSLQRAARIAKEAGVKTILNPAPYQALPKEFLKDIDILIPNETEAQGLSGVEVKDDASALEAINRIQALGVGQVVITVGKRGAYTLIDGELRLVPTFEAKPVDTTAAGDTFCGGLSVALSEGKPIEEAIYFGNRAASIAVTRRGAQPSIPTRGEVVEALS